MICYHFGPWWTRKGLVSSHQGSYSVAPSQTMGLKTKAAQSISRKVACLHNPVDIQIFGRSLRVNCPPDQRDALNQAADDLNQRLQDCKNALESQILNSWSSLPH